MVMATGITATTAQAISTVDTAPVTAIADFGQTELHPLLHNSTGRGWSFLVF